MSLPDVFSRDTQQDLSNCVPLHDLLDDTRPLTASGWISRCETDTKNTSIQKRDDVMIDTKIHTQFIQAETPDRQ